MKNLIPFLLFLLLLPSCTIQKRLYTSGYYIDRSKNKKVVSIAAASEPEKKYSGEISNVTHLQSKIKMPALLSNENPVLSYRKKTGRTKRTKSIPVVFYLSKKNVEHPVIFKKAQHSFGEPVN